MTTWASGTLGTGCLWALGFAFELGLRLGPGLGPGRAFEGGEPSYQRRVLDAEIRASLADGPQHALGALGHRLGGRGDQQQTRLEAARGYRPLLGAANDELHLAASQRLPLAPQRGSFTLALLGHDGRQQRRPGRRGIGGCARNWVDRSTSKPRRCPSARTKSSADLGSQGCCSRPFGPAQMRAGHRRVAKEIAAKVAGGADLKVARFPDACAVVPKDPMRPMAAKVGILGPSNDFKEKTDVSILCW